MAPLTRVQRYISPWATRLFAVAFLDRRAIMWGLRETVKNLTPEQKVVLRSILNKHQVIIPKYGASRFRFLKSFHLKKTVRIGSLLKAAREFYQSTGRDDLMILLDQIYEGRRTGQYNRNSYRGIDYAQVLRTIAPRIISAPAVDVDSPNRLLDQSFEFATECGAVSEAEGLYRMRKVSDMGGDMQTIVASLFMSMLAVYLPRIFDGVIGQGLGELKDSLIRIISSFQKLEKSFGFDCAQLGSDQQYVYKKMSELIKGAGSPQVLLLFFLSKLIAARKSRSSNDPIFDEIRFVYAPLAERLGLIYLADDFRDQHLRLYQPAKHSEVMKKIETCLGMNYAEAKSFLSFFARDLMAELRQKLGTEIPNLIAKFRVKSPYGVWNKVEVRREYSYDELTDVLAQKFIVESEAELQQVYKFLRKSDVYKSDPKKTKIALQPLGESGGWRGIKMVGVDQAGLPVEVQIMTREMDKENNLGKASHWRYNLEKEIGTLAQVFPLQEPSDVMTGNFVENFWQLHDHWTEAA
ncbi:MAG: hypothetical protein ABIE84_03620 [bacterium]